MRVSRSNDCVADNCLYALFVEYVAFVHRGNTYKKITTAGTVMAPPSRKNAPGSVFSVAA